MASAAIPEARAVARLAFWWACELRNSSTTRLKHWWHAPEWPLLAVGSALLSSFIGHWLGYRLALAGVIFRPTAWEGRTGWRKPMLFGISNASVFVALALALQSQKLVHRGIAAHLAAWSTAVEVAIITLQAWREEPSHFNTATRFDSLLYMIKLCGVALLGATCVASTAGCWLRPVTPACNPAQLCALQQGLLLLSLSVGIGAWQVWHGHWGLERNDDDEALCRHETAGAVGSPCYEIRHGVTLKLVHFLPLHATESLLLLAWAAAKSHPPATAVRLICCAAAGHWALALVGLGQLAVGGELNPRSLTQGQLPAWAMAVLAFAALSIGSVFLISATGNDAILSSRGRRRE